MARIISKMYNSEPAARRANDDDDDADYNEEFEKDEDESESASTASGESKRAKSKSARGANLKPDGPNLQLLVDMGQPVDPDLVQALIRECLEEKIASMMANRDEAAAVIASEEVAAPSAARPLPQPSPRRRSTDFGTAVPTAGVYDVETPVVTPERSPPASPRARQQPTPVLTPCEKEVLQPPPTQMQVGPYEPSDNESYLEETLKEDEDG